MTQVRQPPTTGIAMPSVHEIFLGFFSIGINGFGGVMPFARLMLVEQRRWLSADEFLDALSMCQFVPGPNVVNLAVAVGARFQGPLGSLAGVAGIMAAPMVIVIGAYTLLMQVSEAPVVIGALRGMSAVAAGLVVALGVKLALPVLRKKDWISLAFTLASVGAVGGLRLPLLPALAVLIPAAIAAHWWAMKGRAR